MEHDKDISVHSSATEDETSIEKLLRERERLDAELKNRFAQRVTVMFTDIKGSTTFFETYGDIEGRLMVQKHNEMLFPIITEHRGRIIKTIGDAIMAAFDDPVDAVRAGILMQQRLRDYNRTAADKRSQIHIRIGINAGEGLVEKNDIYGDVVNVAARVESLAEADEILVSAAIYDEVRKTDDIICRYVRQTKVKGREEPVEVYRVIWSDEESVAGQTRSMAAAQVRPSARRSGRRLEIDITRDQELLRITAAEKGDRGGTTIRPYEEIRVSFSDVDSLCQEVTSLLNRANTRGKVSKEILAKLRDVGQVLFDTLLSAQAKEALRRSGVEDLVVHIEDTLVQIPWELLHDGDQFLCQKYNMGRIVKTRRQVYAIRQRVLSRPLKMLIVADPRGDLPNAGTEGRRIREQLDQNPSFISANQRTGNITPAFVMEKIRNYDVVHYAGHADYDSADPSNSGWILDGGKFTSADIVKLIGGRPMPALVFCNACQSGQTQEWKLGEGYNQKIFGLANAFLLAGVQHYLGTFWEILDEPSADFAVAFYSAMSKGATIGEAVRQARHALIRQYGEDTIVWASYMLYGDPAFSYFDFQEETVEETAGQSDAQPLCEPAQLRSSTGESVRFSEGTRRFRTAALAGVVLIGLAALVFAVQRLAVKASRSDPYLQAYALLSAGKIDEAQRMFEGLSQDDPRRQEGLAAIAWERGDAKTALDLCSRTPRTAYSSVIKGTILFSQGALDEALKEFTLASEDQSLTSWQRAKAFNGIGRIYSARGDIPKATQYYAQAAAEHPDSAEILANQAYAMQQSGNTAEALDLLQKATKSRPDDRMASLLLADAQRRQKAQEDVARQQRIDDLVRELAESFKSGGVKKADRDTWTSLPLTLSFFSLVSKGAPSEREGEDDYFVMRTSALLQESGVQIVERELLDKLLAELKLGSTALVDPATALQLGRIVNARVVASGTIMRYSGEIQLTMRLTDTETTLMKGAITVSGRDIETLAQDTARKIVEKLKVGYPLRGVITGIEAGKVMLNIGSDVGVTEGMEFLPVDGGKDAAGHPIILKVASVDRSEASATAEGDISGLRSGMRVEQVVTRKP